MLWGLALIPIVVGSYVALRGRNHWPAFLMLLGLIVLLLAMTRPRAILLLPSRLETVMLAIDSSGSTVRATYEPVSAIVNTGDFIYAGTVIGIVDFSSPNAGHCRSSCLHFGLKVMAAPTPHYLNPAILWRSSALLQPSLAVHRSLIADEQSQKSSEAFRH